MEIKLFAVFLAAFGLSFVATAATDDLIVCAGGVYCEDIRLECLASGSSEDVCHRQWRGCVLDACPQ
ncbi:hypothetical protein [Vitiosangium sp. GDMCC 1.1324]|uniref:hypothetical protein n=1 Tax=Vitiosangium sp. (strain GDMCC 1.1324) TaxID=2138576 RepID=UPI000D3B00B9|nr:hypothetical protein [Vitiosangium sp. GDMCC 1.1324]PTL76519.1 hypothetical protein DAT35_48755 [Vitiosangium sp. GDMCC 1.1324]